MLSLDTQYRRADVAYIGLSLDNFELIKDALSQSWKCGDSYLACPVYYLLTGRKGGYLLTSWLNAIGVCRHPHDDNTVLVLPEVGAPAEQHLTQLVMNTNPQASKILFGKLSTAEALLLEKKTGARIAPVYDSTMDWLHPVRVHSALAISRLEGATYAKIRNKIRSAERAGVVLQCYERVCASDLYHLAQTTGLAKSSSTFDQDCYYGMLATIINQIPHEFNAIKALDQLGHLIGIIIWRKAIPGTANVYAHVSARSIVGVADLLMHGACKTLASAGIDFVNVGGSEDSALDAYKKKFNPVQTFRQGSFTLAPPASPACGL